MKSNKEPLITVIVPVFNVEQYLEKCITSIINQTVQDLEIILVNDGSADASGEICDQFANIDDRIKVIHQVNSGVSAARNAGIRVAKGKYITFVDSDDILPQDAYETLYSYQLPYLGLIMGQMKKISEQGELLNEDSGLSTIRISKNMFLKDLFEEKKFTYLGFLWDKLFMSDVIRKHALLFDPKIKVNEDRLFVLQYLIHSEEVEIMLVNHIVYFYRQRSNGVITLTRNTDTVTDSEMTVLKSFDEMQKISRSYSEELYFICVRKAFECALDLLRRVSRKDTKKKKKLRNFLIKNSQICLCDPKYGIMDKVKIVGHTLLKR